MATRIDRAALVAELAALERAIDALDARTRIRRVIVPADGAVVKGVCAGSFLNTHREPPSGEPP